MKTIPIALAPQYAGHGSTLAYCLRIERRDGQVFGFTETDRELTIDALTYSPGFDMSDLVGGAGLTVDNLEITFEPEGPSDEFVYADLLAGLYDNAQYEIFEVNYLAPADGTNLLRRGRTGEVRQQRDSLVLEFRSLKQALQQGLGRVTSKTCAWRFGSTSRPDGLCTLDLADFTFEYTVTAVTSRREFTCSAAAEADDYYAEGSATALDGANTPAGASVGYAQKVKTFEAGVFVLALPMPFDIEVGDTFRFVAGCRKRLDEDCKTKFDNVLNFGGEPHVPGPDLLTADPEASS